MAVIIAALCRNPGCRRTRHRRNGRCWGCMMGSRKPCATGGCKRLTDGRKVCDVCRGKTSGKGRGKGGGPKPASHWARFGL